jgi:hypothetical protein
MSELIAVAAVAVVAWFAWGTIANVRKGRELMRWMQGGLPALGERTTVRWLGSSVVEMTIREAKPPFGAVTLVVFLEARDLPWMWPIGRLRGRRDALIVRGKLRGSPAVELEALDPASWSGRDALPRVPADWLVHEDANAGPVVVHHASTASLERAEALLALGREAGFDVKRLSVRRSEPNFQLHVPLPDMQRPARGFFDAVRGLAERALA